MPILGERHRLNRENVSRAPNTSGVYALYVDGEIAYYGAAGGRDTIRSRLAEHLIGWTQPGRAAARQFSFEVTRFPLSRECALLEEHKRQRWRLPTYNVRPRPTATSRPPSAIEADEVLRSIVAEIRRPIPQRTSPQIDVREVERVLQTPPVAPRFLPPAAGRQGAAAHAT
jgi:hypothetical protein